MVKRIETTGRSEEDAISAALFQLGLERDDVSIEVIERAKSGFLGFGGNPAKVRVSYEVDQEGGSPKPMKDPFQELRDVARPSAPKQEKKPEVKKPQAPKPQPVQPPRPRRRPPPRRRRRHPPSLWRRRPSSPPRRPGSPPLSPPGPSAGSSAALAPPRTSCRRGTRCSSAGRSPSMSTRRSP